MPQNEEILCCCGHSAPADSTTEVQAIYWRNPPIVMCDSCRDTQCFQCYNCDDWFDRSTLQTGPEGSELCTGCISDYFTCCECDIIMHIDNEHEDGGICCDCHQEEDSTDLIRDYSYRPRANFNPKPEDFGPKSCHHYLGVELEVEVVRGELDDTARKTLDILGDDFVYLKRDGSINNGFEIVSHPCSLAVHRDKWAEFFDKRPKGLRSANVDNCGLHVHTSRQCLSDLTIGKMLAFVNSATNAAFVKAVARRESRDYARLDPNKKVSDVKKYARERYEAINLIPEHTIEFRLFKGTLNKNSFFLALEFVQCLIDFCKPSAHGISECIGTEAFFKYVARLHSKKPMSEERAKKLGIDPKLLEKRTGSASHPYPNLAKFCEAFQQKELDKVKSYT